MDAKDVKQDIKDNKYQLPPMSDEQKICVADVIDGKNIVVIAVAGSGKTTTILHISQAYKGQKLLLTYNARLKDECRVKVAQLGIGDMEVHSYHALCNKYYDECKDDFALKRIVDSDMKPRRRGVFELIFIDEMQDMNNLYYQLVQKIIRDMGAKNMQYACFGDPKQAIFQFNLADPTYLMQAPKFFVSDRVWTQRALSTSYRLTKWVTNFVNNALVGEPIITHGNPTIKTSVTYLVCNPFGNDIASLIRDHIREGYRPDDIFVLTPSLRSDSSPARKTENKLVEAKIPCYVPTGDTAKIDQDLIGGKVVFGTFHQVKGLERKIVIVFGMDSSYFTYFGKDLNKDECPNPIYVACTRASEHLILVHACTNNFLPFMDQDAIKKHSVFLELDKMRLTALPPTKKRNLTVSQLVRHKPIQILEAALKLVKYETVNDATREYDLKTKIETPTGFEDVSALYGVAIPAILTYERKKKCAIFDFVKLHKPEALKKWYDAKEVKDDWFLELANQYLTLADGYTYKMAQIPDYKFTDSKFIGDALENLEKHLKDDYEEEVPVSMDGRFYDGPKKGISWCIKGRIDVVQSGEIWELKCTLALEAEHILQTAIYYMLYGKAKVAWLYNCVTNQLIKVTGVTDCAKLLELLIN